MLPLEKSSCSVDTMCNRIKHARCFAAATRRCPLPARQGRDDLARGQPTIAQRPRAMRGPSSEEEKTRLTIVYNVYCESCLVTRNIFSNSENGGIGGVRV